MTQVSHISSSIMVALFVRKILHIRQPILELSTLRRDDAHVLTTRCSLPEPTGPSGYLRAHSSVVAAR